MHGRPSSDRLGGQIVIEHYTGGLVTCAGLWRRGRWWWFVGVGIVWAGQVWTAHWLWGILCTQDAAGIGVMWISVTQNRFEYFLIA